MEEILLHVMGAHLLSELIHQLAYQSINQSLQQEA